MKIDYEAAGWLVFTDCRFGKGPMVGSAACEKCEHFILIDHAEHFVLCRLENENSEIEQEGL